MNTEIDQIFSDRPDEDQTALARPKKIFGWRPIAAIIILLAGLTLGLWYYFVRTTSLADYLPADAEFYVALELPVADTWHQTLKFWSNAPAEGTPAARLYQKLGFSDNLLALFSGQMELARLSGGGLIFKTSLADKAGWLKLVKTDGALDTLPIGWWGALAAPDSKIYWRTDGSGLYLADRADILAGIKNKPTQPLSRQLGNSFIKRDLLTVYLSNLAFLDNLAPAYAMPLQAALAGPLVIKARINGANLVWSTLGAKNITASPLGNSADYDLAIFSRDFSQVYTGWKNTLTQGLLPANVEQLEQIAKEFYQLDIQSFAQKLGQRELTYYLRGSGWLFLAKGDKEPSDIGIETGLESLGASLFAITHPQAVERTLSDGSVMLELRADITGLDWQTYVWTGGGQEYNLKSLKGQGETQGFYTGYVSGLGYILTNQMEFFSKIAQSPSVPSCSDGGQADLGAIISPHLLTSDTLILDIIKSIAISATESGQLAGCLAF